nr:TonB-dependent receptor [uncultured Roseateles sp.]
MTTFVPRLSLMGLACLLSLPALAQVGDAAGVSTLKPVLITGNPLRTGELSPPASVLSGEQLLLKRGSSLGETLAEEPGVSSSYFGPNSNRPVIRGLDGDRVRMLSNSGASVDASSLSFDHALPIDPLVIERVEVLRGAGALLYGGSAVGGVVNTLDNRIPKAALSGLSGQGELRLGGAANERSGSMLVEAGNQAFAVHADAFDRRSGDLRVPRFSGVADGETLAPSTRVRNSASDAHGGALGASATFAQGYAGVSVDDYHNSYGTTIEPDVTIRMQSQRLATAGEWRDPQAPVRRLSWQASRTSYEHQELEASGAVGTTFKSLGSSGRLELEHAPLGTVRGVVGLQLDSSNFSALGDEAFVPSTRTRASALFGLEQWSAGPLSLGVGLRAESVRVSSLGDAAGTEEHRFGAASSRSFAPRSASFSAGYRLSEQWSLSANLSSTQRAPVYYELYANGLHLATGSFEIGDANLGLERARGLDLGLQWQQGHSQVKAQLFSTRFGSFIALDATGTSVARPTDAGVTETPEYRFRAVRARLQGFELEARHRLPVSLTGRDWQLDLSGQMDAVQGRNLDSGEPLPRLAPLRAGLAVEARHGAWGMKLELRRTQAQNRINAQDEATAGYTMVKAALTRQFSLGSSSDATWFLKLENLGNTLAYSATTMLQMRGLSPLPGRSLQTGVQVRF